MQVQELKQQFEQEIKEHELLIRRVCRMYAYTDADRQDLFQDIVIQLWHAYPQFRRNAKLSTWLYRVAINTAITGLRKKRDLITYYGPAEMPLEARDEDTGKADEERMQLLYKAIERLNEVEKAIVMLYMEDNTYEEMEEILGISNSTLRVKMSRIKEKLRDLTKNV